jgi:leucyl aminopeptidase
VEKKMINLRFIKEIKDKEIVSVEFREQKGDLFLERPDGSRVLVIGVERLEKVNHRRAILLARKVISLAKTNRIKRLSLNFYDFSFPEFKNSEEEKAELLATNFEMANFEFTKYRTPPEDGWSFVEEIVITGEISEGVKRAFRTGQIIGDGVNLMRELVNTPALEMTPEGFASETKKILKNRDIKIQIFDKMGIERLKMGGLLGVARGSVNEPRFIVLNYRGAKEGLLLFSLAKV